MDCAELFVNKNDIYRQHVLAHKLCVSMIISLLKQYSEVYEAEYQNPRQHLGTRADLNQGEAQEVFPPGL